MTEAYFGTAWYDREKCAQETQTLFIFGDNLVGHGMGGQAVIRGLPNSIGIPTKRNPSNGKPEDFFTDDDFDEVKPIIDERIAKIRTWSGRVFIPVEIGRGLAEVHIRAPKIYGYIMHQLATLTAR